MLDHDDRDAVAIELEEQIEDLIDLAAGKTGHRLVRDEEHRTSSHGAGQLQPAQLDLAQLTRRSEGLAGQSHAFEQGHDLTMSLASAETVADDGKIERH